MAATVAAVLILTFSVSVQFSSGGKVLCSTDISKQADEPFNLQVAHIDETRVLLGWDFTIPSGLKTEKIEFFINCTKSSASGQSKIETVRDGRGRSFEFGDLEQGTIYTVEITPKADGNPISRPARKIFKTLLQDWQRVVIDSNEIVTIERDSVTYRLTWKGASPFSPQRYEVVVCRSHQCQLMHSLEPSLLYFLKYNESYNVTVTAVYKQPMTRIKRTSTTYNGRSTLGAPSEVRELWKTDQLWDSIHLRWRGPEFSNGPVTYYILTVGDAYNRSRKMEFLVNKTELEARVPVPFGKYYCVGISAVNEYEGLKLEGPSSNFLIEFKRPEKPQRIDIVERRTDSVSFIVTPSQAKSSYYFHRVQANGNSFDAHFANSTNIKGLGPYETVYLSVSACFIDISNETHCGNRLHTSITSNVKAPSEVLNLRAAFSETGKPVLYWSAPKYKRGPIVGYIIQIIDSAHPDSISRNETIAPTQHEFEFEEAKGGKSYSFLIAAYNVDLNTGKKIVGRKLLIEVPSGLATWILVMIVIISVVLLCMFALQIIARKRDLSESKLRFLVLCSNSRTG